MHRLNSRKAVLLLLLLSLFPSISFGGFGTDFVTAGNLDLRANTLSSKNTDGDIILDANGTGKIKFPDLTTDRVPYINNSGYLTSSNISSTEFNLLDNVGSTICGISDTCILS